MVKGKGDGSFGAAESVTLDAYVTFILRVLNYDEAAGDFSWSSAASKGVELGLYDAAFAEGCVDGMTRGALAQVSYAALSQAVKGSSETLAGSLVRLGMVDEGAVRSLGLPLEAAGPSPEPSPESGEDSAAEIQALVDLVNETRADAGLSPVARTRPSPPAPPSARRRLSSASSTPGPTGGTASPSSPTAASPIAAPGRTSPTGTPPRSR